MRLGRTSHDVRCGASDWPELTIAIVAIFPSEGFRGISWFCSGCSNEVACPSTDDVMLGRVVKQGEQWEGDVDHAASTVLWNVMLLRDRSRLPNELR